LELLGDFWRGEGNKRIAPCLQKKVVEVSGGCLVIKKRTKGLAESGKFHIDMLRGSRLTVNIEERQKV